MQHKILGRKIAFVIAHPDDEAVLACGTMAKNTQDGGFNMLYCATRGERGKAHLDVDMNEEELKEIRTKEIQNVERELFLDVLQIGDLPDGYIIDCVEDLEKDVLEFFQKYKPDIVISFGPDGYTGHRDHIIVGSVAYKIAQKYSIPFFAFSGPSTDIYPDFYKYLSHKRKHGKYNDDYIIDHKPDICIEINREVKERILNIYKTQYKGIHPHNIFPQDIAEHMLCNEYYCEM